MTLTTRQALKQTKRHTETIRRLQDGLPVAIGAIHAAIAQHDGFSSGGEQIGAVSSSGHSSPVEAAAGKIAPLVKQLDEAQRHLNALSGSLLALEAITARWGPKVPNKTTRCSGGRTVDSWSRPGCTDWVEYDTAADGSQHERGHGLCMACRKRKEYWEAKEAA